MYSSRNADYVQTKLQISDKTNKIYYEYKQ